jgi:predicted short-subunit dehydrogenase-like oxidoreductase (DUF2520 family)
MKILISGTGNVAQALGKAFSVAGHTIIGVAGRNKEKTLLLADKLKTKPIFSFSKVPLSADLNVIAVKDDAISVVAKSLPDLKGTVVHTSGSTDISTLKRFRKHGVLWPVETFSSSHRISFKNVPFVIESGDELSTIRLMQLVNSLSGETYLLDSHQRRTLHLTAVIVNNFTNYLLTAAEDILQKESLPIDLLKKLAESTIRNAFKSGAKNSQTGPARRNDRKTIDLHLKYLAFNKDYAHLYEVFSALIANVHKEPSKP